MRGIFICLIFDVKNKNYIKFPKFSLQSKIYVVYLLSKVIGGEVSTKRKDGNDYGKVHTQRFC